MSTFVEYDLGEGATILVLDTQEQKGVVKKAGIGEDTVIKAKKKFEEVLKDVRVQSKLLINELSALNVSEAEVKFGLAVSGELGGNMVVGKVGAGVNYEVTLKWSKKEMPK